MRTLGQQWTRFHDAVEHTISSDDQRAVMRMCYFEGVKAMLSICKDAFPDFRDFTPRQQALLRAAIAEGMEFARENEIVLEQMAKKSNH